MNICLYLQTTPMDVDIIVDALNEKTTLESLVQQLLYERCLLVESKFAFVRWRQSNHTSALWCEKLRTNITLN